MPRFFLETIDESDIRIIGEDACHIGRSLRMKIGDSITVCANGTDYECTISNITSDTVFLKAENKKLCASEPSVFVTLYQALPKSDKFAQIVQKSIELGVSRIVPVITQRCVARPTEKEFEKKLPRLQKIAESASKQSGRGCIPEISGLYSFSKAIKEMKTADCAIMLYENGGIRFSELPLTTECKSIAAFIGSEGGFDPEEAEIAKKEGLHSVWLGERILRCETAPQVAISILMYLTGNL